MKKTQLLSKSAGAALALALFVAPGPVFGADYSDLPEKHWARGAIDAMSARGIVNGFPDGSFKPSDTVTYGEFVKMAYIAQGGEERTGKGGNWALPYYEAAAEEGLFARHEIAENLLSVPIPREYTARILSNALGDVKVPNYDAIRERFTDIEWNTPHEYDIAKVSAYGLITGYPDKTFRPEETLTRAEAATVIHRLIDADARTLPDLRPAEEKTPAERLADVEAGNLNTLLEVVEVSVSKRPISEVIDGTTIDPQWLGSYVRADGTVANAINEAILYYEIFEDYPHQMELVPDLLGDEMLAIGPTNTSGFLIRDRKVTAYLESGMTSDGIGTVWVRFGEGHRAKIFPDFDYIGVMPSDNKVLLLIPNNLR